MTTPDTTAAPPAERGTRNKREAATRLDISVRTLERAIRAKLVAVVRLGQRVMVPVAEIERIEREGLPSFGARD